jgi:glycerol-3-phosphate dehydrogenase
VLPFMIPILTKDGVVSKKIARALGSAMWMYDLTGGWRIGKIHRRLSAADALRHLPTMPADRLAGAYLYFDAATDDARLCLTVARTAADHGAVVANGCAVVAITKDEQGEATGADVVADGRRFSIRAKFVVNAAGVWSDDVRALDGSGHPGTIRPAKGIHVTIPWEKVRNDIAVVIPVPKDKRSLFVVPFGPNPDGTFRHTYAGTTDTDYDGPLDDPQCTAADLDYVLRALNASVTTDITADDITGTWAGLRPLVNTGFSEKTADLSRRHRIVTESSGVVSVTGGKLTTYREMAEDTIDVVANRLGLGRKARCRTKRLRLHGADGFRDTAPSGSLAAHLGGRFGTGAAAVQALIAADPSLGEELVPGLPYVRAEAVYAARHEMVRSLDDLLSRRTRARLFDRAATAEAAAAIGLLVAPELGWDEAETARHVVELVASIHHEIDSEQPVPSPGSRS